MQEVIDELLPNLDEAQENEPQTCGVVGSACNWFASVHGATLVGVVSRADSTLLRQCFIVLENKLVYCFDQFNV
jgi:hypothetical protein